MRKNYKMWIFKATKYCVLHGVREISLKNMVWEMKNYRNFMGILRDYHAGRQRCRPEDVSRQNKNSPFSSPNTRRRRVETDYGNQSFRHLTHIVVRCEKKKIIKNIWCGGHYCIKYQFNRTFGPVHFGKNFCSFFSI